MYISTSLITAVLAMAVSAHPTEIAPILQTCKRDTKIWSFNSLPVASSLDRRDVPVDSFFGTPNTTPAVFKANPKIGPPGIGRTFKESAHFRVYDALSEAQATKTLAMMEAAYDCFVNDMKFRTPGLSYNAKTDEGYEGPFYKENIFSKADIPGAIGVMNTDGTSGLSYLQIQSDQLHRAAVSVHEYGHALTYHEKGWVDQGNTGCFWEPIAEWFADFFMTSDICAAARTRGNQPVGETNINFDKVISGSPAVMVDGTLGKSNYYQAWPFFTYITNNPDEIEGLGKFAIRNLFRKFKPGSEETPFHAISYITQTPVREIVARYWARMAFVDIGHPQAAALFEKQRSTLNYANLDGSAGTYKPKPARMPKYFGANIIPLRTTGGKTKRATNNEPKAKKPKGSKGTPSKAPESTTTTAKGETGKQTKGGTGGTIGVTITSRKPFIATLVVKTKAGAVSYVACPGGACTATTVAGDEAMLVIVNAPNELYKYNGFAISGVVAEGLDYVLKLTGATA
ncbi:putative dockerin type 1 protein [Venturia nashicola]|nr:putative dockerin type 1 protein [Venturia nashicola]